MSEIETYDEPSNGDPLDETVRASVASDPRDYFEAGLLIRNLRKRLAEVEKERDSCKAMLIAIANLGGNLPDDRFTDRAGPNDAAMRGLMYVEARRMALSALERLFSGEVVRDIDALLAKYNHGGNVP